MLWTISENNHFYPKEGEKRIRGERRERVSCSKGDKRHNNQIYTFFSKEKKNHTVLPQEVLGDTPCLDIDCNFLRIVMNMFKLSCDLFLDKETLLTLPGNGEQEQVSTLHRGTGSHRAQTVHQCVSLFPPTGQAACLALQWQGGGM